mmetsp:Transcript_17313/g.24452  ORF Transcript_17313/g.24452 Transcript_17313/m.24452 type:complete len:283 (+) Transcript_17313:62-910(+)
MMDACSGRICSLNRVACFGGKNDLISSGSRFFNGPLGCSYGGDNGSALLIEVCDFSLPAASAVNDGARRGLKLLNRAGQNATHSERIVVRVARFATALWRTINGELGGEHLEDTLLAPAITNAVDGVCSHDGVLRCSLLSLWQWIWPESCMAVLRVQSWKEHEKTQRYKDLGADKVMKISDEEREAATAEDSLCNEVREIVKIELDRQRWRGEMAAVAYHYSKNEDNGIVKDPHSQPLSIIEKNNAWKLGGWSASAIQQRRSKGADGGTAVRKVRLTVKSGD